jgi:hypothetical protein
MDYYESDGHNARQAPKQFLDEFVPLALPSATNALDEYKALPLAEMRCRFAQYYASDVSGRTPVTADFR